MSNIQPIQPEKAIEWVQQKLNIELAEKQKEAVLLAGNSAWNEILAGDCMSILLLT